MIIVLDTEGVSLFVQFITVDSFVSVLQDIEEMNVFENINKITRIAIYGKT